MKTLSHICAAMIAASALLGCQSMNSKSKAENVDTQEVVYTVAGKTMRGYLALPKNLSGPVPGVLVVHEWWGQTEYPRRRARMLAELGYAAFAVDMYGDRQIADHPKDAGAFAKSVMADSKTVAARFDAAMKAFKENAPIKPDDIAAVGYCFGGSVVLEMAKQGRTLDGVVSLHGGLQTPTPVQRGKTKAKVLVLNGAADPMITPEHVAKFEDEMKRAGVSYEVVNYPGAKHAFSNPDATKLGEQFGMPIAYNEKADKESWEKMKSFLSELF